MYFDLSFGLVSSSSIPVHLLWQHIADNYYLLLSPYLLLR